MRTIAMTLPVILVALGLRLPAQTASKDAGPPKPATVTIAAQSDLNQLMRGVLYPASNVVFSAQIDNPADAKFVPGRDPSMATDPLLSTFGGWQAVENAALALTESTNLLLIPGRNCAEWLARSDEQSGLAEICSRASGCSNEGLQGGPIQEPGQYG